MKMMLYIMPVMMTFLFLNFASGLNLYYAVSNIASIPQQWMLARERLKRTPAPIVEVEDEAGGVERPAEGQATKALSRRGSAMLSDPIAALATPPGRSALAVVRLSGTGAFEVAARVVDGFRDRPARIATLATFRDADGRADRPRTRTPSSRLPHSYTGEDLVELSCHGGLAGARPAARRAPGGRRPAGRAGRVHPPRGAQRQARSGPGRGGRRPDRRHRAGAGPGGAPPARRRPLPPARRRCARRWSSSQAPAGLRHRLSRARTTARCRPRGSRRQLEDGRGPDRAPARHRARRRATARGRAARARRPAQRRQVVALQRAARHRAGAGDRDSGHHPRRDRGAHRLSGLAGPPGRHGRTLGRRRADRPPGHRGEPPLPGGGGPGAAVRRERAATPGADEPAIAAERPDAASSAPRRISTADAARPRAWRGLRGDGRRARRAPPRRRPSGCSAIGSRSPTWSPALTRARHRTALARAPRGAGRRARAPRAASGDAVLVAHHVREATTARSTS